MVIEPEITKHQSKLNKAWPQEAHDEARMAQFVEILYMSLKLSKHPNPKFQALNAWSHRFLLAHYVNTRIRKMRDADVRLHEMLESVNHFNIIVRGGKVIWDIVQHTEKIQKTLLELV